MNQLRRVQGFAYPTQASRSADVKTGEIAGKEPGVPTACRLAMTTGQAASLCDLASKPQLAQGEDRRK
jgi:hypothetical protein